MDCLMGIDLGSTSLKALVYDLDGKVVAQGSRPTERSHPSEEHPEWTVWLPEQIWGGAAAAIRDAVSQLDSSSDIKAVAVTGMGMDGVPMDADGKWLYPFISWHDARTEPQLEWWKQHVGMDKYAINGNPVWSMNSAMRILWIAENEPDILRCTHKWLLIEDFLNYLLCGAWATDCSMASCYLLLDQRTRQWSDELLDLSGIDRTLLPDVRPSGTRLGDIHEVASAATGLPVGTPVILGGHDHLCGTLPVGAFEPGVALNITGTWEGAILSMDEPVLTPALQRMGMTIQAHVARGRHAAWGSAPAAEMLEWYRKEYGAEASRNADADGGADWDYLFAEAAESPAGARGAMFLPHMSAAVCPVQDDRSLGAFVGLSSRCTRGDVLRAMIEGLNFQFLDVLNAAEAGLGFPLGKIVAVGGGTRNEFGMQNKADITGRAIEVPEVEEASSLGAAILAGIGVGLYKDEKDACARVNRPGRTYQPNPELTDMYAKRYEIHAQLYSTLKSVSHQLFEAEQG